MITRSDIQIYGCSPSSFGNMRSNQVETYTMEHSDVSYTERKCPSSVYELSQSMEPEMKGERGSINLNSIVDDMLKPYHSPNQSFTATSTKSPSECESYGSRSDLPSELQSRKCTSQTHCNLKSINDDFDMQDDLEARNGDPASELQSGNSTSQTHCKTVSLNDDFDMQEDLEAFPYSQPNTPTESPAIASDSYSNPLSYPDNTSSSPQSYKVNSKPPSKEKKPAILDQHYDTSALMYDNDDMTEFTGLVNCNDVLRDHRSSNLSEHSGTIVCCYRSGSMSSPEDEGNNGDPVNLEETDKDDTFDIHNSPNEDADSRKGKITVLQRQALDSIFSVIDRPSRGLVIHIAGELCLHHITVKNFFSNGRRRLRRAAARLSDPERTKRENQKRKEKRRLAALAAAASAANAEKKGLGGSKGVCDKGNGGDSTPSRDPPVLSPERRALMEKLAVKVQRSVAQRGLAEAGSGNKIGIKEPPALSTNPSQSDSYNINNNNNNTSVITMHNYQPHSSENTPFLSTSVHSSPMPFEEPMRKPFVSQNVEEFNYLNQHGEALGAIFAFTETEPLSSYNSSPDQNSVSAYRNEQASSSTYEIVNQEGPYSPTSWQTLIHA